MPKTNKKTLVLLDMHAILHRAFHALPSFTSPKGEPTGALYGLTAILIKIIRELKPDYLAAAYDLPEPTFRHAVYEKYKAERPNTASDLAAQIGKSYEIARAFSIPYFELATFEADDIIGTIVEKFRKIKDLEIIVASGDMDTLQLVENKKIMVYTLRKGIQDTILYDEEKVKERYGFLPGNLIDFKGLKGDPSDNIIGVPGIGDKSATQLIQKFGSIEDIYKKIKKDRGLLLREGIRERIVKLLEEHEEEALFSKTLATIRRDAPINISLNDLAWSKKYKKDEVVRLFKEFGFLSLLARLPEDGSENGARQLSFEENSDFLKSEKKIFWFFSEEAGKIYAASEAKKIFSFFSDSKALKAMFAGGENYFFDAKKFLHLLSPLGIDPQVKFDLKLASWLARPQLANPTIFTAIHNFLPKEALNEGDESRAASLLPLLYEALNNELRDKKLESVYFDIEMPLIKVLFEMEKSGILTDREFLKKASAEFGEKLSTLETEIWKLCGSEFNISSPKQLGEILFEKLKLEMKGLKKTVKGARSTRESELLKLKDRHPVIEKILNYRELSKLKSTYIDALPPLADVEGRVHTNYEQTGTVTGRLSSSEPNMQNIPMRSEIGRKIRRAFIAEKGFELVSFDYSQIELRIAAILSKDKKMTKAFKEGKDIHSITASEIFNVKESDVTDDMRRKAKVINFGILYGMGVGALSQGMGVSRDEAERFWEEYFSDFEGVSRFIADTIEKARISGFVETLFGRKRFIPEIYSQIEYIRKEGERMAVNAPIQGTAADIVKLAMVKTHGEIKNKFAGEARQLLQIHDELLFEVKKPNIDDFVRSIKKILEEIYQGEIKLIVDTKVGVNWGEMRKYN